ncbi:hypothetical protein ACO0RG_004287 [Hanseniaspora osmophila]|uniref:Vacuolar calcium ion transporter n=1 Tax=Hanseniaspora osmophila TaxID=56408 RepID=A0A1E5RAT6_9ASCO|nr:Vacuolar calcium ion transporter [Hanseniaspora osmophila]
MVDDNSPLLGNIVGGTFRHDSFTWKRNKHVLYEILTSSYLNILLVFIPIGILAGIFNPTNSLLVFGANFLAIIPLSAILAYATEELAKQVGSIWSGLLNATLGNAIELIVSILALKEGQVRVVQASMMGSIFSNLLLVTGCCFIFGGWNRVQQSFNTTAAQTMNSLLIISCASLMIPTVFKDTLPDSKRVGIEVLELSRYTSIILLVVYLFFLIFQLKTHHSMFEQVSNAEQEAEPEVASLGKFEAIFFLALSTVLVSICADYLVGSIDDIVIKTGLTKTFVALVLIPIIGNAAEHVTSVYVAVNNKMDLALSVSVGSSIQVALFVLPLMVLIGWIIDIPMSLQFSTFETVILFISVFLSSFLIMDGESNWLEGVMSVAMYFLIAVAFYFYPDI